MPVKGWGGYARKGMDSAYQHRDEDGMPLDRRTGYHRVCHERDRRAVTKEAWTGHAVKGTVRGMDRAGMRGLCT